MQWDPQLIEFIMCSPGRNPSSIVVFLDNKHTFPGTDSSSPPLSHPVHSCTLDLYSIPLYLDQLLASMFHNIRCAGIDLVLGRSIAIFHSSNCELCLLQLNLGSKWECCVLWEVACSSCSECTTWPCHMTLAVDFQVSKQEAKGIEKPGLLVVFNTDQIFAL